MRIASLRMSGYQACVEVCADNSDMGGGGLTFGAIHNCSMLTVSIHTQGQVDRCFYPGRQTRDQGVIGLDHLPGCKFLVQYPVSLGCERENHQATGFLVQPVYHPNLTDPIGQQGAQAWQIGMIPIGDGSQARRLVDHNHLVIHVKDTNGGHLKNGRFFAAHDPQFEKKLTLITPGPE